MSKNLLLTRTSDEEKIKFVAVLLWDAVVDFFDALTAATTTSVENEEIKHSPVP